MHGSSQPLLAETSNGTLYVIKLAQTAQGPNALFNDALGTELYRSAHLPVPDWKPLIVPAEAIHEAERRGIILPRDVQPATICFGSRFLGGDHTRILEILPGSAFGRIYNAQQFWLALFLDFCANHCDNRQAIFRELPNRTFETIFIDHGHMFGGADGTRSFRMGAAMYLDLRVYPTFSRQDAIAIRNIVKSIRGADYGPIIENLPLDWKTNSGIQNLEMYFANLFNPVFLSDYLDQISQMPKDANGHGTHEKLARRDGTALLHSRVQ